MRFKYFFDRIERDEKYDLSLQDCRRVSFFSWFWIKNGQTLGMQAWRIKLISTDGKNIDLKQASIRLLAAIVSAGVFGLGYLWILLEAKNRSWHDIISKTRLILLPDKDSEKRPN